MGVICLSDGEILRSRAGICPCDLLQCPQGHVTWWGHQPSSHCPGRHISFFFRALVDPPNRCTSLAQKNWEAKSLKDSGQSLKAQRPLPGGPVRSEAGVGVQSCASGVCTTSCFSGVWGPV